MKKSPSSLKEEKEILDSYNDVDNDENKDTSSTNAKPCREKEEEEDSKRKFHSLGKLIVLIIIMVRMQPTFIITYREIVLLCFLHFIVITSR